METSIKIEFTPGKEDYVRASRILAKNTPGFLVMAGVVVVLILASLLIMILPTFEASTLRKIALIFIVVGVFYIFYYLVLIPSQLSRMYKNNEYLQHKRLFTFTDDQVVMKIDDKNMEMAWENIQKVIDDDQYYLLIYKGEEDVYPFIPKRSFKDQGLQDEFLALLESKSISVV